MLGALVSLAESEEANVVSWELRERVPRWSVLLHMRGGAAICTTSPELGSGIKTRT